MNSESLKNRQAPLKEQFRADPMSAVAVLRATGRVDIGSQTCRLRLPPHDTTHIIAGLHPMTGGDGAAACSADMLLQSLVSCAGVTLAAVSTAMGLPVESADIVAEGVLDFRGTLGTDRAAPVGMTAITLRFEIVSAAELAPLEKLIQLTERYCVVLQTLKTGCPVTAELSLSPSRSD